MLTFHQATFASESEDRVILNIGGIANITILNKGATTPVSGFDTGPGNTLMDSWIRQHLQVAMDNNGEWAASGQLDHALLEDMLSDPYFLAAPPKSTGREYFNRNWLSRYTAQSGASASNIQAILCELTAQTIATAVQAHAGSVE